MKYKQIQTYMKLGNEENFRHIFKNFRGLLHQIGISTENLSSWESKIARPVNSPGLMTIQSIPSSHEILLKPNHMNLMFYPSIIIWKDQIDSYELEEPWVELLVIIKSETKECIKFEAACEELVFNIMSMFSEVFQETGVYVTNEIQDGEAFLGFVCREEEKYWEFDCAIIPSHLQQLYENTPIGFKRYALTSNGIGYVRETYKFNFSAITNLLR